MIIFVGNDGTAVKSLPSPVYQGGANANTIYLVAPFAENLAVTVAFQLPNGVAVAPAAMTAQGAIEGLTDAQGSAYAGWAYDLPNSVTALFGTVTAQFYFYAATGKIVASSAVTFTVGRGVPQVLPDEPDDTVYEQILAAVSGLQSDLSNGYYAARAIYAWNSTYTYGANEITFYPDIGEYGAFVKSLAADNTQPPYTDGAINAAYWSEVVNFNTVTDDFFAEIKAAQTAAEAAQAAAETAQTGAETAETNAQTAEQGAQAAQTAAETAQTGAESAQTAAEAAQTAAENAANAASGSAGQAADFATAAQSSASAASASATAAQGYMEQAKEYAQKEYKLYESFADLPVPGNSAFIYLVPQSGSEEHDNYAEYLWISESGAYEFIGTVNDIDLSNYARQDGTYPDMTVGNATNASHATSADSATSAGSANDPSSVHFTEQTLTSKQQEQARTNIGAASEEELVAGLAEKQPTGNYALQDGTYSEMTVGNATNAKNDGERNSIYDSYLGWWNMGALKGNKTTSQDFDDYTETGCYEILGSEDSQAVNNPVSTSNPSSSDCNWYFLVFTRTGENFITQIAFSTREDNAVAIRSMSNAEWGSWRLISEEGSAPTADKVANALTIRNMTGTGNVLYDGSSALTIDLSPQTTNVYAEITAANMFAYVYAHIVMQRWGNKANIHMDFRIDLRSGNPTANWTLFTTARLADVLGFSSLSFESNNTRVMIENCPSGTFGTVGGVYAGYTGFVLAFDSTYSGGIGIGRFFNQPSNDGVGGWEVTTEEVYSEDYIYHADIWGADVS